MPARASFAALLRRYRRAAGITQEELAARAGLSVRAVGDLERDDARVPRRDTRDLLAEALALSDEDRAALERAAAQAAHGRRQEQPAPRAGAAGMDGRGPRRSVAPLDALPAPLTSFIGREREIAAIGERLLEPGTRLLTLLGPGGVGKTRLALEVVAAARERFAGGVAFVPLASIADPALVLLAIAAALGVQPPPGQPVADPLAAALADARLLLLLDNFEQVRAAAAEVLALLARAPGVTALVTSRFALRARGERRHQVEPLAVPRPPLPPMDALSCYEAVRLFAARARDVDPAFALTAGTAPAVAAICARLDGLPLAIELVAARTHLLSPAALLARLAQPLAVVTGGAPDLPDRQRTLRATIDWSHGLLGQAARRLFARLAVFPAEGATLVAIEAICDLEGDRGIDVLEAVESLLDSCLLRRAESPGGEPRLSMLETIREYAREHLAATGEEAAIRERHLAWYAQRCEEEIAGWSSTDQAALLRRLDAELENIRAALAWGLEPGGDAVAALRLTSALSRYWTTRGLVSEGRRWTARALDAAPDAPAELRATALNRCAILARMEGDGAGAGALWEASLALFRALGDEPGIARVVMNVGLLRYDLSDDAGSIAALTESLTLKRQQKDQLPIAEVLLNLGMVLKRQHCYAEAEEAYTEACAIWEASADQAGMANIYLHMADLARDQQQLDRAVRLYTASLRISLTLGDRPQVASAIEGIARLLMRRYETGTGDHVLLKLSAELFACAAAVRESTGVPVDAGNLPKYRTVLQQLQALLGPAAFEAAWAAGWEAPVLTLIEQIPL